MKTSDIAKHMLNTQKYYTAATLARELKIPIQQANSKLFNIRASTRKYITDLTPPPNRTLRVLRIQSAQAREVTDGALWSLVLNNRRKPV